MFECHFGSSLGSRAEATPCKPGTQPIKTKLVDGRSQAQDARTATLALVSELKQCGNRKDIQQGKLLHLQALESGAHTNIFVSNTLISMYSKCGSMLQARRVFDTISRRTVVSWNNLILGYVDNGESLTALETFNLVDCAPDSVTFLGAIKACTALAASNKLERRACLEKGMALHRKVRELGLDADIPVANTLVDMYSKCGEMQSARMVFDKMRYRGVISWTTLVVGYVENGQSSAALDVFNCMDCTPDRAAFVAALKACASIAAGNRSDKELCLRKGMSVHGRARELGLETELYVANTLVDMYSKCGDMAQARGVFDRMTHRDVVSWTALITGYVENGESLNALEVFNRMESSPNRVTYVAVMKACGYLGALDIGRGLHDQVCKLGLEQDETLASSLVDFYGKCGKMDAAERVFNRMQAVDGVTWNSLISGYSSLGDSSQVFRTAEKMQECGIQPDSVTMLLILTACSHAGTVEKGDRYFQSISKLNTRLTAEHYTCMVDMLGRVNRLDEALVFVREMPVAASSSVWMTLLGGCRKWGNLEIGQVAFSELLALDDDNECLGAAYVLMRNIYERLGLMHGSCKFVCKP